MNYNSCDQLIGTNLIMNIVVTTTVVKYFGRCGVQSLWFLYRFVLILTLSLDRTFIILEHKIRVKTWFLSRKMHENDTNSHKMSLKIWSVSHRTLLIFPRSRQSNFLMLLHFQLFTIIFGATINFVWLMKNMNGYIIPW